MRKAFVTLLALGLCLFTRAQALPATPYDASLLLWYPSLSPTQQVLFDQLYAAATAFEERITLPANTSYDDAICAVTALIQDCPELSGLDRHYSLRYYQNEPDVATQLTLTYTSRADERDALMTQAQALAQQATGQPWDQALALHDALCATATYAFGDRAHDAYGALLAGEAVCEGYANAYTLLCRLAGLRCGMVIGTATAADGTTSNHAWNMVWVDGSPMLVDVTWDDQDSLGIVQRWYFGLTDEMMSRDHLEESTLLRTLCDDESLNWHVRTGVCLPAGQTADSLAAWWKNQLIRLRDTGDSVEARFEEEGAWETFLTSFNAWTDDFNARQGANGLYGSWSYTTSGTQRVFSLTLRDMP